MPHSTIPTPILQELARSTPELQAYVSDLQADQSQFHNLALLDDPGEGVELVSLLGASMIKFIGDDSVAHHHQRELYASTLAGLLSRLGRGIAYQERITDQSRRAD